MTEAEALEVMAMLAARFPGQLPEKTAAVWASDLAAEQGIGRADGMEAAQQIAKTAHRLFYADFIAAAGAARDARNEQVRIRRETMKRENLVLPARTAANPIYPRATIRAIQLLAEAKATGRRFSPAEWAREFERIVRSEAEAAAQGASA